MDKKRIPEILAPAGGPEALRAAVLCGASAVYLGGRDFNARKNAANFSGDELLQAVSFCHTRGVKVYQTINTMVFDSELDALVEALSTACNAGVDGIITQDMAVVKIARKCSPSLPLHASTQMSVHNLDGVKALEQLGFSRVVLARELSRQEIEYIASRTKLEIECFVHGALCVCMSGQCYLSSMIGGRSGNRGLCAQPCRLPFASDKNANTLSLKDLSLAGQVIDMASIGVKALKIEGRLKRPEYVAAAVTACVQALAGEAPDIDRLRAVFSRSGFTDGYYAGKTGNNMFGVRVKEDAAPADVLKELSLLYAKEAPSVPVNMRLAVKRGIESNLSVSDDAGNTVYVNGSVPEEARNSPLTQDKAIALLSKTGGTPFYLSRAEYDIDDGLMLPASALNAMRREALEKLNTIRGAIHPHEFTPYNFNAHITAAKSPVKPLIRVRIQYAKQLTKALLDNSDEIVIPVNELGGMDASTREMLRGYADKTFIELPRVFFGDGSDLDILMQDASGLGISRAVCGNLGGVEKAKQAGFEVHGDFGLNAANPLSLEAYAEMGLKGLTLSYELRLKQALAIKGGIPRGIIAYGYLPLMLMRNYPAGTENMKSAILTDRLGNKFPIRRLDGVSEIYNTVPLVLSDKLDELTGFDFITLYFTIESAEQCIRVLDAYKSGSDLESQKTRGLYYRKVR